MYLSSLHGQGTSCWPGASGAPTLCMHGTTRSHVTIDLLENGQPCPRHDPHADDDVGRIGQLDTDLRHRRSDDPHAERQDVHRPAAHGAVEEVLQLPPHLVRVLPVVRRAGGILRERADERALLDPGDIARVGARVVASRPGFLVEPQQGARPQHLFDELVVLFLRAVDPVHARRTGQLLHLLDPSEQVVISSEGNGWVATHGQHSMPFMRAQWT